MHDLTDSEKRYLNVPYEEKDAAKQLGAKWDSAAKKWFITENSNIVQFARWLPVSISGEENLRSDYFYLAQTNINCYKCKKTMGANAIILPEGFEEIDDYSMDELEQAEIQYKGTLFRAQNYRSIISYIVYISPEALEEIYKYVDYCLYSKEYSRVVDYEYYRSICTHCNAAQGDNYIIAEHDAPFDPLDNNDFNKINFYKIQQKIKIKAGSNSIGYGESSGYVTFRDIRKF